MATYYGKGNCFVCGGWRDEIPLIDGSRRPDDNGAFWWDVEGIIFCPHCGNEILRFREIPPIAIEFGNIPVEIALAHAPTLREPGETYEVEGAAET